MNTQKNILLKYIDDNQDQYINIARQIFANPETSNHEYFACKMLSDQLESHGFSITRDVASHPTGFTAVKKSSRSGPRITFLAEYDALEGLGHGCGHNLIGTISTYAAIALSKQLDKFGGELRVYGTPGEEGGENGSAKEDFVTKGYFDDVDIAMEIHPSNENSVTPASLAVDPVDIEFWGRSAHAGLSPELGINALDALILTYNGINALRQHLTTDVKIHGIILNGGSAPNIVPDYARGRFYLRAKTRPTLNKVFEKVEHIVQGAAMATGATCKIARFQNKVDDIVRNEILDDLYRETMSDMGVTWSENVAFSSTDAGNVSHVIPLLHPMLKTTSCGSPLHSMEFRESCIASEALSSIATGAKLLALTAMKLFNQPDLVEEIKLFHKDLI
ncbi:MAG: amidohydrolase [Clostridiales bacterium]|jgi:amidohydrolase|nr:amidohydrolase [Clostridiales bacterium]